MTREAAEADGWYLRLSLSSADGQMQDSSNALGQLAGASLGADSADLKELAPFGERYLSLVFPHPEWGERAGDYATDQRPPKPGACPAGRA